jgi:hypothetical protein
MRLALQLVWLTGLLLAPLSDLVRAQVDDANTAPDDGSDPALEQARVHFRQGVDAYRTGNYRGALVEFRAAYELRPNYKLLYNMAQSCMELQNRGPAVDYLTRYLAEGSSEIPRARREEAERTLRWLESRVAQVRVVANRADAEIYVDDLPIGRTPLAEEILVSAGPHTFSARKRGLPSVEQVVEITAGDPARVELEFTPPKRAEFDRAAAPNASSDRTSRTTPGWSSDPLFISTAIATAVLAAAATTMTVLTVSSEADYESARDNVVDADMLGELSAQTKSRALATDLLWAATVASGVVATVAFVRSGASEEHQPAAASARLIASPARLTFRAQF